MSDVNRLKYNITFVEDGLNELPYKQTTRKNFFNLAKLLIERLDKVQNETVSLAYSRFLDLADGDMLDTIASNYFISRDGNSDDGLRSAIKLHALRQNTEPTRSDIVKILKIINNNNFIKIYKGYNNYIEVVISVDCLSLQELRNQLGDLFPINTNLKVCSIPTGALPFGVGSEYTTPSLKIGKLGSIHNTLANRRNVTPITIVDEERDL